MTAEKRNEVYFKLVRSLVTSMQNFFRDLVLVVSDGLLVAYVLLKFPEALLMLCYFDKPRTVSLLLPPHPMSFLQEIGDKERQVASLSEQIAAADAAHAQAKAERNEAQDRRKEAWREADELSEQHKAASEQYSKAEAVRGRGMGHRTAGSAWAAALQFVLV
jgi:hypothetical protein